jgi:hypothetical protein
MAVFASGGITAASLISVRHAFLLGGGQPAIEFDIVEMESHSADLEVTDNPVETGVVVSDHAFMKPRELEIRGVVSDTPLRGYDPTTGERKTDRFYSSSKQTSRSASAWEILRALQTSAEPFSIQTGLEFYQSFVIASLSADQDASTENGLVFRMRLREVIRRSTQTVTYPPRAAGKPHRQASKKAEGGEKKTAAVTDEQKAQTLAFQGMPASVREGFQKNGVGGAFSAGVKLLTGQ